MSEERFSLPPLITDDIEGNLVMIFLKPTLIPSLNSNQYLEFRYCWWGSDIIHKSRLTSDLDELRVVFDIRCDVKGFQRYLADAACLNVDIFVVSKEKANSANYSPVKYQVRRKQAWKTGDYIGKFILNNLKLNNRGEYVNECNIINSYNDHLGTVVIFMLFTPQNMNFLPAKNAVNENEKQKQLDDKNQRTNVCDKNDVTPTKNIKPLREHISPNNAILTNGGNKLRKKLFSNNITPTKARKELRENLSPRFVVFDNSTNTKSCKSILKKGLKSPSKIKESLPTPRLEYEMGQVRNLDVPVDKPETLSQFCDNNNDILAKLFSFVDSGAIDPTDLPTLIQICQGRSPSIDLDHLELHDRSLMNLSNSFVSNREENLSSVESCRSKDIEKPLINNLNTKRKVNFSYSAPTYCSSLQIKQPKVNRVLDEEFLHSLSLKDRDKEVPKETSSPVKSFPEVKCKISTWEKREQVENIMKTKETDSSLLVLRLHSVHFNYNFNSPKKDVLVKGTQNKKLLVRQRSKLCYFIEVDLEFEKEESCQSTLFVSRQITECKEITFNTARIFRLPKPENENNEGYLKFKVSRRRLGNRLRELVGVGIISLNKLGSRSEGEKSVMLPLWAASDNSEKLKFCNDGKTELPLGSFQFSVTFALANSISCIEDQPAIFPNHGLGSSHSLRFNEAYEEPDQNKHIPDANECKDILNETFTTETSLYCSEEISNTKHSLIIENGSDVKYIPQKSTENVFPKQEVNLEILEGNGLPLLRSKNTGETFSPSTYVLTSVPPTVLKTNIIKWSTTPVWNYRTKFAFYKEDLEHTNFCIILKVFHSLNGLTAQPNDPLLGFAQIDTNFLWTSFLSLCGWVPVRNLQNELCGEIKVSLTPVRSRLPLHTQNNLIHDEKQNNQSKLSQDSSSDSQTNIKSSHDLVKNDVKPSFVEPVTSLEPERLKDDCCKKNLFHLTKDANSSCLVYQPSSIHQVTTQPLESMEKTSAVLRTESQKPSSRLDHPQVFSKDLVEPYNQKRTLTSPQSPRSTCTSEYNHVIEAMRWMNHGTLDSPWVSYLDLDSKIVEEKEQGRKNITKRKSRIAANLNFLA